MKRAILRSIEPPSDKALAEKASSLAKAGIDSYSGYGVGAVVVMEYSGTDYREKEYFVYGGMNINLSGMEIKLHAEQLALFQALTDLRVGDLNDVLKDKASIHRVVTNTSGNDLAIRCGHCFSTIYGACEWLGTDPSEVEYSAVKGEPTITEREPDGVNWTWDRYTLEELYPGSYTEKR